MKKGGPQEELRKNWVTREIKPNQSADERTWRVPRKVPIAARRA